MRLAPVYFIVTKYCGCELIIKLNRKIKNLQKQACIVKIDLPVSEESSCNLHIYKIITIQESNFSTS